MLIISVLLINPGNMGLRKRVFFYREMGDMLAILEVLNSWTPLDSPDCLRWMIDASRTFTTKSAF